MRDLTPDECAEFDAAHERIVAALAHPSVAAVIEDFLRGAYPSVRAFLRAFFALPAVQALVAGGTEIASDALGAVVAGAVASTGIGLVVSGLAGDETAVLVKRGLVALDAKLVGPTPTD